MSVSVLAQTDEPEWLPPPPENLAQVLAFDGDDLISQGSGLVVAPGVVLTSAHYLEAADRLALSDATGNLADARTARVWAELDLAVLTVADGAALAIIPARFAAGTVTDGDRVTTAGFWSATLEGKRSRGLFGGGKPRFLAVPQEATRSASGFVRDAGEQGFNHLTVIGRGGYGAPVFNICNQVVGLNRLPAAFSLDDAWARHMPAPPIAALTRDQLIAALEELAVTPQVADQSCLSAAQKAETDKQEAEEKAAEAEKAAEEAKRKADEAARQAQEAEGKAEQAEREAEQTKRQSVDALSSLSERLEQERLQREQEEAVNRQRLLVGVGAGAVLVLALVLLWAKRRRDLRAANAVYADCLLQGHDSANNPIALRISGRDLARSENGVVIGRNPEGSGVVVGDETVGRNHARLSLKGDQLTIEDLGSVNGTRVNGAPIPAHEKSPIQNGDRIELASVDLVLKVLGQ